MLKRTITPLFAALLFVWGCTDSDTTREYPIYRVPAAPTIDGIVEQDPGWATIPRDRAFVTPFIEEMGTNFPAYKQTAFRMGYDDTNLYVAIICREPWTRYMAPKPADDEPFEKDDGVELLLSPKRSALAHFVVNAVGTRWNEAENGPPISLNDWEAESRVTDTSYVVEMQIPFAILGEEPRAGAVWMGNVVRNTNTIISPEDRQSSWSPVLTSVDDPRDFGRFVFNDEVLDGEGLATVDARLAEGAEAVMQLEEEFLLRDQEREDALVEAYEERVTEEGRGLLSITRGPADLIEPPSAPSDEVWRYGLGFPIQIGPNEAALLTNIRMEGSGNIDFEIGTDVILFNDLDDITAANAIPISRYERTRDAEHGEILVRKGPVIAGFVPFGALLEDGTPHPHAGTGFGIGWAVSHKVGSGGKYDYTDYIDRRAALYQFAYDGDAFRVLSEDRIDASTLLPDWNLVGNFITSGIPDGEDILYVMIARVDDVAVAGFTRWRHDAGGWKPVSFTPVTGFDVTWSEPSLIRDAEGRLLFSARSYDRAVPVNAFDIAVWQSLDDGLTWKQVVYEKNRRARSPVSIDRTADGTPFIAANIPPLRRTREILAIWPLNDERTGLEGRITARDAPAEFGPAPSGSWWRIDHPTSAVIRLSDGQWHSILSYRIVDNGEVEGSAPPAPQTGTYVEEVMSAGEAIPPWNF